MTEAKPRCRVLLVDDEPMVLSAIGSFLSLETEHEVVSFSCPHQALRYLSEHQVDVVVADLWLRGMDGGAFLDEVRRLDRQTRLVVLSGCADDEWMDRLRRRGLHGCLDKPWCNDELEALIESACRGDAGPDRP